MRHNNNQQNRRFRGRNNGGNGGGGHNHGGHSHGGHNNHNNQRRVNPRVQTFDSNGPDVRIRGNAIQINEKYMALARDAAAAGDRVLAESYYQHAEHYQRMLNEAAEEQARYQAQYQQSQPQPAVEAEGFVAEGIVDLADAPQPVLNDLDQGFLVGGRQAQAQPQEADKAEAAADAPQPEQKQPARQRRSFRPKEAESA